MLKPKKQIIYALFAGLLFLPPMLAEARGLVPCGGTGEHPCTVDDIFTFCAKIISLMVSLAGIVAVTFIIKNGFTLVMSAGDSEAVTKGKKGLTNAIIGFAIVMLSFVLINTVVKVLNIQGFDMTKPQCYLTNC